MSDCAPEFDFGLAAVDSPTEATSGDAQLHALEQLPVMPGPTIDFEEAEAAVAAARAEEAADARRADEVAAAARAEEEIAAAAAKLMEEAASIRKAEEEAAAAAKAEAGAKAKEEARLAAEAENKRRIAAEVAAAEEMAKKAAKEKAKVAARRAVEMQEAAEAAAREDSRQRKAEERLALAKEAAAKKAVKEAAKAERLAAKAAERAAKQVVDDEAAAQRAVEAARKLEEEEERARQKAMEEEERERLEAQKRAEREASEAAERKRVLEAVGLQATPDKKAVRRPAPAESNAAGGASAAAARRRLQAKRASRSLVLPSAATDMGLHARCVLKREALVALCAGELSRLQLERAPVPPPSGSEHALVMGLHRREAAERVRTLASAAPPLAAHGPRDVRMLLAAEPRATFTVAVALELAAPQPALTLDVVLQILEELARAQARAASEAQRARKLEWHADRQVQDAHDRAYAAMDVAKKNLERQLTGTAEKAAEAARRAVARQGIAADDAHERAHVLLACSVRDMASATAAGDAANGADGQSLATQLLALDRTARAPAYEAFARAGVAPFRVLESLALMPLERAAQLCEWTVETCGAVSAADMRRALQHAVEHDATDVVQLLRGQPIVERPPSTLSHALRAEGYAAAHLAAVDASGRVVLAVSGAARTDVVVTRLQQDASVSKCEYVGAAADNATCGPVPTLPVPPNAIEVVSKTEVLRAKVRDKEAVIAKMEAVVARRQAALERKDQGGESDSDDDDALPESIRDAKSDFKTISCIYNRRERQLELLKRQVKHAKTYEGYAAKLDEEASALRAAQDSAVTARSTLNAEQSVFTGKQPLLQAWKRFRFGANVAMRQAAHARRRTVWLPTRQHHMMRRAVLARGWLRRMIGKDFHEVANEHLQREILRGWYRLAARPWSMARRRAVFLRGDAKYESSLMVEQVPSAALHSLGLGFRRFAFGVAITARERHAKARRLDLLRARVEVPSVTEETHPHFFCPIGFEVMVTPTVAPNGLIYEGETLLTWRSLAGANALSSCAHEATEGRVDDILSGDVHRDVALSRSIQLRMHAALWSVFLAGWRRQARRRARLRHALETMLLEASRSQLPSLWRRLVVGVAIARRERLAGWASEPGLFPSAPALGTRLSRVRWLGVLFAEWRAASVRRFHCALSLVTLWEDACLEYERESASVAVQALLGETGIKYKELEKDADNDVETCKQDLKDLKDKKAKDEMLLEQLLREHQTKTYRLLERTRSELPALKRAEAKQAEDVALYKSVHLFKVTLKRLSLEDLVVSTNRDDKKFVMYVTPGCDPGAEVELRDEGGLPSTLRILSVQPGSPASIAGLRPGDLVAKVSAHEMAPTPLKWRRMGNERPAMGTELTNEALAAALKGKSEFTLDEWSSFGITHLQTSHYVQSARVQLGDSSSHVGGYYQPTCASKPSRELVLGEAAHALQLSPDAMLQQFIVDSELALSSELQIDLNEFGKRFQQHCIATSRPAPNVFSPRSRDCYGGEALLEAGFYSAAFARSGLRVMIIRRPITPREMASLDDDLRRQLSQHRLERDQRRVELDVALSKAEEVLVEAEKACELERTTVQEFEAVCIGDPEAIEFARNASEQAPPADETPGDDNESVESADVPAYKLWPLTGWVAHFGALEALDFFYHENEDQLAVDFFDGKLGGVRISHSIVCPTPSHIIDLPHLRHRLAWKRAQRYATMVFGARDEAEDTADRARSALEVYDRLTPEVLKRKAAFAQDEKARSLAQLRRSRMEYTLRVIGIGDRSQQNCNVHVEGDSVEYEVPVESSAGISWCLQLELQVERPPPLTRAIAVRSYSSCTAMLTCCGPDANARVLNAVFGDLLDASASAEKGQRAGMCGGCDELSPSPAMPPSDVKREASVPLLRQLLSNMPRTNRLRWLMGRPMREDLLRCFQSDDGGLGGRHQLSELCVQDASLPRAFERLGFHKTKLALIYERCCAAKPDAEARSRRAPRVAAAPVTWRGTPQQWHELLGALGSAPPVCTSFHLQQLVAAMQEVVVPACPLLLVLFGLVDGPPRDELLSACFEVLVELASPAGELTAEQLSQAGLSPMHLVAATGDAELTQRVSAGLPVEHSRLATLFTKSTPLSIACVNGFEIEACLHLPSGPSMATALLHAAEHFQLVSCRQLLTAGASAGVRDAGGLSALDHLVRLGYARLAPESHAAKHDRREHELWCHAINELIDGGADPFFALAEGAVTPIAALLAHYAWADWPSRLREQLSEALASDVSSPTPVLHHVWHSAGLHAFALSPSEEAVRVAGQLLELGGCSRAQRGGTLQTVLHLLAAGGAYSWSDDLGLSFLPAATSSKASSMSDAALDLAKLVVEFGAEWRARDAGQNTAAHVACACGNVPMVDYLASLGAKFEKPWFNARRKVPKELAESGGAVLRCLHGCEQRAMRERKQRESEVEQLHGATSIEWLDPSTGKALLERGVAAELLLGGMGASAAPVDVSTSAVQKATSSTATSAPAVEGGDAATDVDNTVAEDAKDALHAERRKLCAALSFTSPKWHVNLTRHALEQLRLLHQADVGRCHNALRLLHRLAEGIDGPENSEAILERAHPGPLCCSELKAARSSDKVYLVWERSEAAFFEAAHAVRIWSIETTRDKLDACASFVTTAWELGARALAHDAAHDAEVTYDDLAELEPFAMGTTATLDRPAEKWHPVHADDADSAPVPFIVKWFPLNGLVTRQLLLLADEQPTTAGGEVALPMLLDEREKLIVHPPVQRASLILGRSGTGKTSIALQMLHDTQVDNELARGGSVAEAILSSGMLGKTLAAGSPALPAAHVNVLFVTKSLTLTRSLQRQFGAMLLTLGVPALPTSTLVEHFAQGRDLPQPLFLCSSEWLTLLDRLLPKGERFFGDEQEARSFVAEFSGDADSLGQMLNDQHGEHGVAPAERMGGRASGRHLLTYEQFARWARLDGWLAGSRLSPSSAYREIFSYIKGSAEAMATRAGCLSRAEYLDLPSKMTAVPTEQRPAVYSCFEKYVKKCRVHGTYDAADVVCHLSRRVSQLVGLCTRVHRVLVDEVQDLTQAELELLLKASGGDSRAFVIFGDTAQTISRGVGFRFADVKQLFWRAEQPTGGTGAHGGSGVARSEPAQHELWRNYRTHQGIIGCSACLVALIQRLFPTSIDALEQPERGHFPGPPPALLPEIDAASLVESMLAADEVGVTEMGANQVVLVRSEASKANLPPELAAGLALTIEEAKGLEFDDVCIYEFFSESPAEKEWHVLYTMLPAEAMAASSRPSAVDFDPHLHLVLCEELKMLYVALTRARKRVFLFDSSLERRAPAFDYLAALGVAEEGLERQLSATASKRPQNSVADWRQRAENFESNRLWRPAEQSFLKAGLIARALHAGGHRLVAEAKDAEGRAAKATRLRDGATAFLQAATRADEPRFAERAYYRAAFCYIACAKNSAQGTQQPGGGGGLESQCFVDAGNVIAHGLRRPRKAAACHFVAAVSCALSERVSANKHYAKAERLLAEPHCEAFDEKSAARKALRQLAANGSTADVPMDWLHSTCLQVEKLEAWLQQGYQGV